MTVDGRSELRGRGRPLAASAPARSSRSLPETSLCRPGEYAAPPEQVSFLLVIFRFGAAAMVTARRELRGQLRHDPIATARWGTKLKRDRVIKKFAKAAKKVEA